MRQALGATLLTLFLSLAPGSALAATGWSGTVTWKGVDEGGDDSGRTLTIETSRYSFAAGRRAPTDGPFTHSRGDWAGDVDSEFTSSSECEQAPGVLLWSKIVGAGSHRGVAGLAIVFAETAHGWRYHVSAGAPYDVASYKATQSYSCGGSHQAQWPPRPATSDPAHWPETEWRPIPGGHTPDTIRTLVGAASYAEPGGWQRNDVTWTLHRGPAPACSDGRDNDRDGKIDYAGGLPAHRDPGCDSSEDQSEHDPTPQCRNGTDDDGDGRTDAPGDPGCAVADDPNERGPAECDNGDDDDRDGLTDFQASGRGDGECSGPEIDDEGPPHGPCRDGLDNDGDLLPDFGRDVGCASTQDQTETCDGLHAIAIAGKRPKWGEGRLLARFAHADDACNASWMPEVDWGITPQGLALLGDGTAYVGGYHHIAKRCRIVHVDLESGDVVATLDLPLKGRAACDHASGIAVARKLIWVADTERIIVLKDLQDRRPRAIPLVRPGESGCSFNASFISETGGRLNIGHYRDEKKKSTLYQFRLDVLLSKLRSGKALGCTDASFRKEIPTEAQGADFLGRRLWVSASDSWRGRLHVGLRTFEFGPGVEEIEFAADGSLWTLFEAGSKKYPDRPYLPIIARFDPGFAR